MCIKNTFYEEVFVRVTNVNVFSGLMSEEKMVSRTAGEDCGKQDGDFLSWTNSSWSLQGVSRWTEVSVEDLCRKNSDLQLFRVAKRCICAIFSRLYCSLGKKIKVVNLVPTYFKSKKKITYVV